MPISENLTSGRPEEVETRILKMGCSKCSWTYMINIPIDIVPGSTDDLALGAKLETKFNIHNHLVHDGHAKLALVFHNVESDLKAQWEAG